VAWCLAIRVLDTIGVRGGPGGRSAVVVAEPAPPRSWCRVSFPGSLGDLGCAGLARRAAVRSCGVGERKPMSWAVGRREHDGDWAQPAAGRVWSESRCQ
jgi:hypothetical protein